MAFGFFAPSTLPLVLLADDSPDMLESLGDLLELKGFAFARASGGQEALDWTRALSPQAVQLDLGMPKIDGYDVARRLRAEPRIQSMFIAAVTGYSGSATLQCVHQAGFDQHLAKPVDHDRLFSLLKHAVTRGSPNS